MTSYTKKLTLNYLDFYQRLNKTIETGPWQDSILLQAFGNKLVKHRDKLHHLLKLDQFNSEAASNASTTQHAPLSATAPNADMQAVFISLYSQDGLKLSKWEAILENINRSIASRPIYGDLKEVKSALRERPNKQNEAYCLVYVKNDDILKPSNGIEHRDQNGNQLIILKKNAVQLENIIEFVHMETSYIWQDHQLIAKLA